MAEKQETEYFEADFEFDMDFNTEISKRITLYVDKGVNFQDQKLYLLKIPYLDEGIPAFKAVSMVVKGSQKFLSNKKVSVKLDINLISPSTY